MPDKVFVPRRVCLLCAAIVLSFRYCRRLSQVFTFGPKFAVYQRCCVTPARTKQCNLFGMSTTFTNTHTHWQQSNCGNRRIWFWSRSGSTNQLEDSGGWHRKIRAKNKAHTHRPLPQRTLIEIELLCSLFLFFRLQILLAKLSHGRHGCFVCLMHEFCCNGFGGSPNLPFGYVYKLAVDDRLFVSSQ